MAAPSRHAVAVIALCGLALLGISAVSAQSAVPAPTADEEIIVTGRSFGELRLALRRAEDAVYARFNDINSDDRFDIHCFLRAVTGTRIQQRICQSNIWRELDGEIGQAYGRELQGSAGIAAASFQAEQVYMQRRLYDELRRLAAADEQLRTAVLSLNLAQRRFSQRAQSRRAASLVRHTATNDADLPFDAEELFEAQVGRGPWMHRLSHRVFTFAGVSGEIRKLELVCDQGAAGFDYQADAEWALPDGWSACSLFVDAKRNTSFTLYEFE